MTKPRSIKISAPFDPRHVGGVSIPGTTLPAGISRAPSTLEPDTTPSHTFAAHGTTEVPRRSNTVTTSLAQPSLKLKASISLLRGRSSSSSPDRSTPRKAILPPARDTNDMPVPSLRQKTSTSKFWQRPHPTRPTTQPTWPDTHAPSSTPNPDTHNSSTTPPPPHLPPSPPPLPPRPTETPHTHPLQSSLPPAVPPKSTPLLPFKPTKPTPAVRPKRADSGTAIDFDDVPALERPLGFREILARPSLEERMALYKRTREYWARADHGLGEWVGRVGGGVA